jgi:hypothetical protein
VSTRQEAGTMSTFFIDLVEATDEARRAFETNSKVLDIVANGLSLERYRNLLLELYHVVWHFNPTCAAAACRITDQHRAVRYFLYDHMNEEKGHEEWVLNDLSVVGVSADFARAYMPTLVMLGLNGYNYWSADRRHPCSVLGMIYTLEVVASVYGGQMTAAISDSLMLQGDRGISFISSWQSFVSSSIKWKTRKRRRRSRSRRSSTSINSARYLNSYERSRCQPVTERPEPPL